ncbi:hypothetical protein LQF76_12565 [Gloeomargaritales cyanobacterium VI4D9]|nr:hypothetical protein LQF76_12565 [Gloeomargaritales cyanobacterium VI4D9]
MDEFLDGLLDVGADEYRSDCQQLTPDQEYELWCHYQDMQKEQLLAAWGVETWEELEAMGHDW